MRFWRERLLPALERELPDGDVLARPDALHRGADVDPAESSARLGEQPVDVGFRGEVGLRRRRGSDLTGERVRALLAPVVVDDDARAFAGERAHAGAADSPRRSCDEHTLVLQPGLDARRLLPVSPRPSSPAPIDT